MSDLQADLADYLDDGDYGSDSEPIEAPADADVANGMLRRRQRLLTEIERVNALAATEVARIQAWQADRTAGAAREVDRLNEALRGYMTAAVTESTLHLPNGVLRRRPPRPSVRVVDSDAFDSWVASQRHGQVVALIPPAEDGPFATRVLADKLIAAVLDVAGTRVDVKPDKKALAAVYKPAGDAIDAVDGGTAVSEQRLADDAGEFVAGVVVSTPKAPTFTIG